MPSNTDFIASLEALKSLGAPRVWSMLVSIFGELSQGPEDRIDGPVLTRLTDKMDIKPEAVRVALHRLRKDNWITSVKTGRTASYGLTHEGIRQRNAAAPWIYNAASELPTTWQMVVTDSNDTAQKAALTQANFCCLMPRVYVAHGDAQPPADVVISRGAQAPVWVAAQIIPTELTTQFSNLLTVLNIVRHRMTATDPLCAGDRALLRCLIVHHWRRLALRHPYLPPSLIGEDWPGHTCRIEVVTLLRSLLRPTLADLAAEDHRTRH